MTSSEVVTLCGSTKFKAEFLAEQARLTLEGAIVISVGVFGHTDMPDYDWTTDASDLKRMLDGLHFQKIDMADRVHVVNPGGYIGESTRREVAYAVSQGKPVTYFAARAEERENDVLPNYSRTYLQAKKLLEAATPGPWAVHQSAYYDHLNGPTISYAVNPASGDWDEERGESDAALIAAAPDLAQTVIDLWERVRQLEHELDIWTSDGQDA